MRKHLRSVATALCVLVTFVVGGSGAPAQQPDRSKPPKPGPPQALRLPDIQARTLSNGLAVRIVEMHEVPVVQATLLVAVGSGADPSGKYGLASLTAAMLDEGAGTRDALEVADAVDYLGASLSTSALFDASTVSLWVPVERLEKALAVMADVATRPTFPVRELERLRKDRLTSLLQARDDPSSIAEFAFPQVVFGPKHRYGTLGIGTPATIASFTTDDLRRFHSAHYRPERATLIVVGDVRPDSVVPLLEGAFGSWKGQGAATPVEPLPAAAQLTSRQVYIVDKPGAAQSEIRIGWVGVARSTPDYFPLVVLNTLLGGSFTSRLNQNLREEHGYTYGAGSSFSMRLSAGPFVASAGVETDKTAEAVAEFFNEFRDVLKPVPADELAKTKNYVALSFPGEFETTSDVASRVGEMVTYGLPEGYFSKYVERIQAVTAEELQRVAQKYLQPDKFAVVVVGDRKVIEQPLKALNLGPVKALTVEDVMGPV
ncbi:MAG: M16 family metallopeptidase [Vicinamibacterales bacterium]